MDPVAVSIALAGLANQLILAVKNARDREGDHAERTLVAIVRAAHATETYEADRERKSGERDPSRESQIAGFWKEASTLVQLHDRDLGARLWEKGDYWMNPSEWTDEEISDARIELVRVTAEANRLLKIKLRGG